MSRKLWRRHLNLSEILSEGFLLLRNKFGGILLFTLTVNVPLILFCTLFPTENYSEEFIKWLSFGIDQIDFVFSLFVLVGIAFVVETYFQGKTSSFSSILQFSFSRIIDVFLTDLLLLVVLTGLFLLLVIPALIWGNYYSFAIIISALRNIRGKAALSYSKSLVQGFWWKVFGIYSVIIFLTILFNFPFLIISKNIPNVKFLSTFLPHILSDISIAVGQVFSVIL